MKIYTNKIARDIVSKICKQDLKNGKRKNFEFHYLYVISHIRIAPILDRRILPNDFVPVNLELLESLISKAEASSILKKLLDNGVLETDGKYISGYKSTGYRLTPEYKAGKWSLIEIKDSKLNLKLDTKHSLNKAKTDLAGRGYQVCNYWMNELSINLRQAKSLINKFEEESIRDSYTLSSTMIHEKEFFYTVDKTAGRLHNNIANFPTPLRKYLNINGNALWNVDIANSQPLFLGVLMINRQGIDKTELEKYLQVCIDGQFYEKLAEFAELDIDLTDYKVRKEFKQKIFQGCLFDRNRKELSKWELIFQKAFPTIFNEVRNMKRKDYNSVAIALQREEAKFIFHTVDVIDRTLGRNTVPLLTIHDSIVSDEHNIFMVEQIMTEEFKNKYNITPKLTPTKL